MSLAKPKEEYATIKEEEEKTKNERKEAMKKERDAKKEQFAKVKSEKSLNFDETNTLFVRNLAFTVTEDQLKTFFEKFGPVKYAKICKNRETQNSKGTAFVLMANEASTQKVTSTFEKYETNKELNPFQLEGRNFYVMSAVSRENVDKLDSNDKEDKRNRKDLYYGLKIKENTTYSEEDKKKREEFFALKKTDFKSNPNLHVSSTSSQLNRSDFQKFDENDE